MKSLLENETIKLCLRPKGRKSISSKLVFHLKRDENGRIARHKARLVAKGFSKVYGIDYTEVYAPVTRYNIPRMLVAIAATEDCEIVQADIETAFLNGKLQKDTCMEHPEGLIKAPILACKLQKNNL